MTQQTNNPDDDRGENGTAPDSGLTPPASQPGEPAQQAAVPDQAALDPATRQPTVPDPAASTAAAQQPAMPDQAAPTAAAQQPAATPEPPAAKPVVVVKGKSGRGLAAFALLLALGGLAGSGWLWWQQHTVISPVVETPDYAALIEAQGQRQAGAVKSSITAQLEDLRSELTRQQSGQLDALRNELTQQQGSQLDALRSELTQQQGSQLNALRSELPQQQGSQLDALRNELTQQQGSQLDALRNELTQQQGSQLDALRNELTQQQGSQLGDLRTQLTQQQGSQLDALRNEQAQQQGSQLDALRSDLTQQQGSQLDALRTELTQRQSNQLAALRTDLEQLQGNQQREIERLRTERSSVDQTIASLDESSRRAAGNIQRRLTKLESGIAAMANVRADDTRILVLAETEYLLRAAAERLQLFDDPAGALRALELAASQLESVDDPTYMSVRQTLAGHQQALKSLKLPDRVALSGQLLALARDSVQWPLDDRRSLDASGANLLTPREDEEGLWPRFKSVLASVVVVHREKETASALLTLEEERLLRENVRLQLQVAQLAAVRGEQPLYDSALATVREWVEAYFNTTEPAVSAALGQIEALAGVALKPPLPEIGGALKQLRSLRATEALADPVEAAG